VVMGSPGHKGQTSFAALSQTVKTKSSEGEPGLENSFQDLLPKLSMLGRHTFSFHDRLGHDRTCGISCAEEQYVVMWHCSISFRRPAKRKHCAVTPWLRAVGEANDGALDCFHKLRWKLVFILKERVTKTV